MENKCCAYLQSAAEPDTVVPGAMAGEATEEVSQIITFGTTGVVERTSFDDELAQMNELSSAADDVRNHSIVDILSRPYLVDVFQWNRTDTFNSVVAKYDFLNVILAQPNVKAKLLGFTFLKVKAVEIRLLVNAQPFQQGRLLTYFTPYSTMLQSDRSSEYTMTGKTGFDRCDMDISTSQELTFRVPYVSPYPVINLINEQWNVGEFKVAVYSELAGGTETSVSVSVWMRLIDPTPTIPTSAKGYFQARLQGVSSEKSASQGPVSKMMSAAGSIAEKFANVPALASVSGVAANVASAVGSIASLFGWSKPTNDFGNTVVQQTPMRHFNNSDGADQSKQLALSSVNSLSVESVFGRDVDEMALSYIARRPNFLSDFAWREDLATGSSLFKEDVDPYGRTMWNSAVPGLTDRRQFTHLGFVANNFLYWRGGITYTLKFVKTKFHSGRIQILIRPKNTFDSTYDPSMIRTEIVDIASVSEYTFTVPFMYERPWCRSPDRHTPFANHAKFVPTVVEVRNLTQLRRPNDVVSDSITIIVEVSGAEDIEFAFPRANGFQVLRDTPAAPAMLQIGFGTVDRPVLADLKPLSDRIRNCTVGESVRSAKQLMLRVQEEFNSGIGASLSWLIYPEQTNTLPGNGSWTDGSSYFSAFSSIFGYYRGGTRNKIISLPTPTEGPQPDHIYRAYMVIRDSIDAAVPYVTPTTSSVGLVRAPYAYTNLGREGVVEMEVPYYGSTPIRPTNTYVFKSVALLSMDIEYPQLVLDTTDVADKVFMRGVSDDFMFGYVMGVPVMASGIPVPTQTAKLQLKTTSPLDKGSETFSSERRLTPPDEPDTKGSEGATTVTTTGTDSGGTTYSFN